MNCIICQDSGSEPLQDNTLCSCKYKRHSSCWIDYVHSTPHIKCLICRKDLSVKPVPKTKSSLTTPLRQHFVTAPYTSQPPSDSWRQITYQEFVDTINQNTTYQQNAIIDVVITPPVHQQHQVQPTVISKSQKILKIALCLGILIAIVVILVIIL
jgi:hypothetical protein